MSGAPRYRRISAAGILLSCLVACGGGAPITSTGTVTVQVTVQPGAITCNQCTVTVGAAGAASAPAVAASQPAAAVPVGQVQGYPLQSRAGMLRWQAGGITYAVPMVNGGDFALISIFDAAEVKPDGVVTLTNFVAEIDNATDLHLPANTDAAVRDYLATKVIPPLDAWIKANPSVFMASDYKLWPVNVGGDPAAGSDAFARIAARLPQWVQITPQGATLKQL